MDAQTQSLLQTIYRRESRSFLQYINQVSPWSTPADRRLIAQVQQMAAEEAAALRDLAAWMEEHNVPLPYLGAFPIDFGSYNFLAIRALYRQLQQRQAKECKELEEVVQRLDGASREAVTPLLELNRKHLDAINLVLAGK